MRISTLGVRILFDLLAVGLLIACLAYWWLDNLSHELIGSAMFVLIIAHNVFNRRTYSGLKKGRWDTVRVVRVATILSLALAMLILLVTSLLISRDLFTLIAIDGGFALRAVHMFTAYWTVFIVAVHLGTRWAVVMNVCRSSFGLSGDSLTRTLILRGLALLIAVRGIQSSFEMMFGSKLMLRMTLDLWDFNASTLGFFLNYLSIIGLYAALSYYGLKWIQLWQQRAAFV